MRQKPPILNCNNNINCIISPTAKVNAAAITATKILPLSPPVPLLLHILLKPVRFSALYSLRQWLEPLTTLSVTAAIKHQIGVAADDDIADTSRSLSGAKS